MWLRLKSRQSVEGARAFAHLTFEAADVSGGGTLTTSALRTYFEGHPEQEQHILGDDFLWNNFFQLMDSKFADGDVFSFDETEFTAAVVQVYVYVPAADEAAEASAVGAVDAAKEDLAMVAVVALAQKVAVAAVLPVAVAAVLPVAVVVALLAAVGVEALLLAVAETEAGPARPAPSLSIQH